MDSMRVDRGQIATLLFTNNCAGVFEVRYERGPSFLLTSSPLRSSRSGHDPAPFLFLWQALEGICKEVIGSPG